MLQALTLPQVIAQPKLLQNDPGSYGASCRATRAGQSRRVELMVDSHASNVPSVDLQIIDPAVGGTIADEANSLNLFYPLCRDIGPLSEGIREHDTIEPEFPFECCL